MCRKCLFCILVKLFYFNAYSIDCYRYIFFQSFFWGGGKLTFTCIYHNIDLCEHEKICKIDLENEAFETVFISTCLFEQVRMIPIRVLHPSLDFSITDDVSKAYVAFFFENARENFYYLYNKFNLTRVEMNISPIDARQSNGEEVLRLINDNIADSFLRFVPSCLPKNVSASGTLVNYYRCNLITFLELHMQTEDPIAQDSHNYISLILMRSYSWYSEF